MDISLWHHDDRTVSVKEYMRHGPPYFVVVKIGSGQSGIDIHFDPEELENIGRELIAAGRKLHKIKRAGTSRGDDGEES